MAMSPPIRTFPISRLDRYRKDDPMWMLSVAAALATVLTMTAPVAASAATAHNVVLVPGAFADKSSWDKVAHLLRCQLGFNCEKSFHAISVV
jgi:ABC-type Fe2+-enterobactin transport system substrate-binding protein